jgi:hypothetical protein
MKAPLNGQNNRLIMFGFNQSPSPQEEEFYKQVLEEVESGVMRKGIYAKALADSSGDGGKAQSLYIKYRVQSLIEEQENLGHSLPSKRQQKRIEKKAKSDEEWENTHWFHKLIAGLIGAAIFLPAWFWFSTKFLGM